MDHSSGRVQIEQLVTAFECGAILNPDNLKNQVEGAVIMGLAGALFDAIRFSDGIILNASFSRYRVPRFSDVPVPAVGNAIFQATGRRLRSLPMVPNGLRV